MRFSLKSMKKMACTSEGRIWPKKGNLTETYQTAKGTERINATRIIELVSSTRKRKQKAKQEKKFGGISLCTPELMQKMNY